MKLLEVARIAGGEIVAPREAGEIEICGVATIERAGPADITFVAAPRYERYLETTSAAAVMVTPALAEGRARKERGSALVQVADPYRAFVRVTDALDPREEDDLAPGIHPTAIVPASALIHPTARIGAFAVLGEQVAVGPRTRIWPHVVLGSDVAIGADCVIYSHVTIRERCHLGNRVILHPGAVIGADGFGYLPGADGRREKVPQVGTVRIEDDVEIGANTTVDRATIDETVIRRGAKLDNLVQIAHNVEVGEDSCLAAQVGIAGSCRIGARNLFAGQAGAASHLETCDDTTVLAKASVFRSITEPGTYYGTPAIERNERFRMEAALQRLPEALRRLRQLERRLAELEGENG